MKGPQLIKSLRKVPTEYLELVDAQNKKIQLLSLHVMSLNDDAVVQSQECTNKRIKRETEISNIIDELIILAQTALVNPTVPLTPLEPEPDTSNTESYTNKEALCSEVLYGNEEVYELLIGLENLKVNLSNK
jgi:hypothetical protein